ncbi:GNAT family N-acetyltransferase [Streptomyces spororaveus]|uniref:Lysine N-acyltransferase MbtK n=1 Tax=Streptomyces spororaveus TaxID=284039 RepID=A0ABQ3TB07_9ACTN|nr:MULTISPECIES: GNAT family N-acetyltransferase [Streptomyces]MCM9081989.1 acetyltransferase [Streptomyces spororaveus]MCX5303572.1 acetyltransferase [Streptomyces sp. NBC_00160]GHI77588.1 acetyltransferase [Streptomyces spororaveus]
MTSARSAGQAVYTQAVEGFGTVTLTPVDPAADSALIHSWVTQERARFWGMGEASRELVQEIYEDVDRRTTHHAYMVSRDGEQVALFQTYECAEDRVSECYEVQPGDVGVHLLIGPITGVAEHGFTGSLMTVFIGFVFSDDTARRVVVEPDARNTKAVSLMERTGFVLGPEVVLPEIDLPEVYLPAKPARLAFLASPGAATTAG